MNLPGHIHYRLQYQHLAIKDLVGGLTSYHIRRPLQPGKWSIFEHLVHLASYQAHFLERIHHILQEKEPYFARYTAEADPLFHDQLGWTQEKILADIDKNRTGILQVLGQLSSHQLERKALHPGYGSLNISGWAEFFLLHEAHHLFAIFKGRGSL